MLCKKESHESHGGKQLLYPLNSCCFLTGRVTVEENPNENNVIDADHTYSSMKVPANAGLLDSASQTDSPDCQTESSENQTEDEYESEFKQLKLKVKDYIQNRKSQLTEAKKRSEPFTSANLLKDKITLFWTGLPKKEVFDSLFRYFEPIAKQMNYTPGKSDPVHIKKSYKLKPGKDRKIPLIEEFFAVLVRLKVGLIVTDISSRLGISEGHFSKIFDTWIKFLRCELEALTRFLQYECFGKNYWRKSNYILPPYVLYCKRF